MKIIVKFILRCVLMVFTLPALFLTAVLEWCSDKPNWVFWKSYNSGLLRLLPWSKY